MFIYHIVLLSLLILAGNFKLITMEIDNDGGREISDEDETKQVPDPDITMNDNKRTKPERGWSDVVDGNHNIHSFRKSEIQLLVEGWLREKSRPLNLTFNGHNDSASWHVGCVALHAPQNVLHPHCEATTLCVGIQ